MSDIYTQPWNPAVNTSSQEYDYDYLITLHIKKIKSQNTQNKETAAGKVAQNQQFFSKLEPPSKYQENAEQLGTGVKPGCF